MWKQREFLFDSRQKLGTYFKTYQTDQYHYVNFYKDKNKCFYSNITRLATKTTTC